MKHHFHVLLWEISEMQRKQKRILHYQCEKHNTPQPESIVNDAVNDNNTDDVAVAARVYGMQWIVMQGPLDSL